MEHVLEEERGYFLKHDADGDGALDESEFVHHWVASVPPDFNVPACLGLVTRRLHPGLHRVQRESSLLTTYWSEST